MVISICLYCLKSAMASDLRFVAVKNYSIANKMIQKQLPGEAKNGANNLDFFKKHYSDLKHKVEQLDKKMHRRPRRHPYQKVKIMQWDF